MKPGRSEILNWLLWDFWGCTITTHVVYQTPKEIAE